MTLKDGYNEKLFRIFDLGGRGKSRPTKGLQADMLKYGAPQGLLSQLDPNKNKGSGFTFFFFLIEPRMVKWVKNSPVIHIRAPLCRP